MPSIWLALDELATERRADLDRSVLVSDFLLEELQVVEVGACVSWDLGL